VPGVPRPRLLRPRLLAAVPLVLAAAVGVTAAGAATGASRPADRPDARVGGTTTLDRGGPGTLEDPTSVVERNGSAYVAWAHSGVPRLCSVPAGGNRCARTRVLPAFAGRSFHLLAGAPGVLTLAWTGPATPGSPADTLSDRLFAATSSDGGATFGPISALADLPPGSLLTSASLTDVGLLAATVSRGGVTVRAVSLGQTTTSYGGGAFFPGSARDAQVSHSSTGPVLVISVPGQPPVTSHYAGSGTADDASGWTGPRSIAGVDDVLQLPQTPTDPVLVNRASSARLLTASLWTGSQFGRGVAADTGGRGPLAATVDVAGRLTVVRGGGSGSGLVASSTLTGAVGAATPLTFSLPARVLVPRGAGGARPAVAVDGHGSGLVAVRTSLGGSELLVLQRFQAPVPPKPSPKPSPTAKPTGTPKPTPSPSRSSSRP